MLSVLVFWPLLVAVFLAAATRLGDRAVRWTWLSAAVVDVALVVVVWLRADRGAGFGTGRFTAEEHVSWIPSLGVSYHVGVDGLSLPMVALTAVLFLACAVYSFTQRDRIRLFAVLMLFLQTVCLGLFVSLDLIVFFVFFDLSIVGMYFVIAGWGHGGARAAALKFFLYTFVGSLALLLGFIGLYLAATPHTFDMVDLARTDPLAGRGAVGAVVLLAVALGLAIKTPTVPFHTWLPPAHTQAPAAGSAILAGVLLKMGTYGFVRIAMPMLPSQWRHYAWVFVAVGVVSVVYGALVALAQTDIKAMIAYTSINHMGYILLAVGVAGLLAHSDAQARTLAVTGAVVQMVSHGLITGALFLLTGVLRRRGGTYDMGQYSGLAGAAPRFAGLVAVGFFASLGLPAFSGFIAEFQIFTGSLGAAPWWTAVAVLGIVLTAGLFLRAYQRMMLGELRFPDAPGTPRRFRDLTLTEALPTAGLLLLAFVIGVAPRFLLDVVEPAARTVVDLVSR